MTEEQGEALLKEIRALRSEVRGVRMWSRLICAILLIAGIAAALYLEGIRVHFTGIVGTLAIIAGGCLVLWLLWCALCDMISTTTAKSDSASRSPAEPMP